MNNIKIVSAKKKHIKAIGKLLRQVLDIHYGGRPDIFKKNAKKYSDDELEEIIDDGNDRFIFVAVDDKNEVAGYVFCNFKQYGNDSILTDIKTLYIDDLCVDEKKRGTHIGQALFKYAEDFAKKNKCHNLTLNVWSLNRDAELFYLKMGMTEQKKILEKLL